MATMNPSADPSAAGADPMAGTQPDDDSSGYTIEIEVAGDGSITVSCESGAQESAEGQGGEGGDEANSQPAKNIKEALTIALGIYKADGQMPNMGAQDAAFDQGYGGGSGQ